jgi:hypothetical protein
MTTAPARPRPARPWPPRSWSARARSVRDWASRARENRSRNTTRRSLRRLLASLLILTFLVFITTLLTFTRVHRTAETVRTRTAPAIVELAAARLALVRADAAAVDSFQPPRVQLIGPDDEFQNQMAIADRRLTQVAEHNVAGEPSRLELVEGLLVRYQGQVWQADAHFRQSDADALSVLDLWDASRLLHGKVATQKDGALAQQSGIFSELDQLAEDQRKALNGQLAASALTPAAILAVLVPLLGLLGLLLATQLIFRRRFRRQVNPWLLLATALLLAMAAISASSAAAQHRLEDSRGILHQLVADRQAQGSAEDAKGLRAFRDLLQDPRCAGPGGCGYTADLFGSYVDAATAHPARHVADLQLTGETDLLGSQTAAATADAGLEAAIYVLAVLVAAAVFLGFRPRLSEYRYRPR